MGCRSRGSKSKTLTPRLRPSCTGQLIQTPGPGGDFRLAVGPLQPCWLRSSAFYDALTYPFRLLRKLVIARASPILDFILFMLLTIGLSIAGHTFQDVYETRTIVESVTPLRAHTQ